MSDEAFTLHASRRDRIGTRYARRLREAGRLPAVLYGHKQDPVPIALDAKVASKHIGDGERVFRVVIDGAESELTLVKELQFDYLGAELVHVDLARVDMDERVHVTVPIHFIGDARGLREAEGAVLTHPISQLELECSVVNLPEYLEIDVSDLGVGDSLAATDVPLPFASMKLLTDPDATVAQVTVQYAEAEEEEAVEVASGAEPEVLTEKKPEDSQAEEEAG